MPKLAYVTQIPLFDELRGPRVLVRPYREADAPALFAAIDESREHLRPWMLWADQHQTMDDTRDVIVRMRARWVLREELDVGVWEAASGRLLGGAGYHARDWDVGYLEIGYWLRAAAEGRGYMTEAVRLLADYAFAALGCNRVEITCDARNARSAAIPRRLGFRPEGRLRDQMFGVDGRPCDRLVFALTPGDPR